MKGAPVTDSKYELFESKEAQRVDEIARKLQDLLYEAYVTGVVVTVELESLEPLAMRNYRMHGSVRGER